MSILRLSAQYDFGANHKGLSPFIHRRCQLGGISNNSDSVTLVESSLEPNTKYWYRTHIETGNGSDDSTASFFITLPQVSTVNAAPVVGGADISGTLTQGSETISNVNITWAEDAGFTQNVQVIDKNSGVVFTDTTYTAQITGLTAGKTYYVKVEALGPGGISEPLTSSFDALNTMIYVTFETMDFHVDQTTYPKVAAGTFGQSDVYYAVVNHSDFPVTVEFQSMEVVQADGISFVPAHTGTDQEIVLKLELPDPSHTGGINAFTASVGQLDLLEGDYAAHLGILDGQVISGSALGDTGYLTLSGTYAGSLAVAAKRPKVKFVFTYSLVMHE